MKAKKYIWFLIALMGFSFTLKDKSLKELLKEYNKGTVPYIYVSNTNVEKYHLLDTREKREYDVSHLKNALFVGYDSFDAKIVQDNIKVKSDTIVVYCSLGIRSEDIGEKLLKLGYTNVFNLYGGIFEWKNKGNQVYDNKNKKTEKIHGFSKEWGKWLRKGEVVYD